MLSQHLRILVWALAALVLTFIAADAFSTPVQPSNRTQSNPPVIPGGQFISIIRGVQVDTLTPNARQQLGLSRTTMIRSK